MTGPDHVYLAAITNAAEEWIRHCNDRPEGYAVGRVNLRVVLAASSGVHIDDRGRIAWRGGPHRFTAEPAPLESPLPPA